MKKALWEIEMEMADLTEREYLPFFEGEDGSYPDETSQRIAYSDCLRQHRREAMPILVNFLRRLNRAWRSRHGEAYMSVREFKRIPAERWERDVEWMQYNAHCIGIYE